MKFNFRLQKLLENRKTEQDVAQKEFQIQLLILKQAENILFEYEEKLKESYQRLGFFLSGGSSDISSSMQQIADFQKGIKVRIHLQKTKIESELKLVEDKREILRQASINYKMMEKLKEKNFQNFLHDVKYEEQKQVDEVAVLRFRHKEVK